MTLQRGWRRHAVRLGHQVPTVHCQSAGTSLRGHLCNSAVGLAAAMFFKIAQVLCCDWNKYDAFSVATGAVDRRWRRAGAHVVRIEGLTRRVCSIRIWDLRMLASAAVQVPCASCAASQLANESAVAGARIRGEAAAVECACCEPSPELQLRHFGIASARSIFSSFNTPCHDFEIAGSIVGARRWGA